MSDDLNEFEAAYAAHVEHDLGRRTRDLKPAPSEPRGARYGHEFRNADRECYADLAAYLAVDLPDPPSYARHMIGTQPILALAMQHGRWTDQGFRLAFPANDRKLLALRSLGLVEVTGFEPSSQALSRGLGQHLTNFGDEVRRKVIEFGHVLQAGSK